MKLEDILGKKPVAAAPKGKRAVKKIARKDAGPTEEGSTEPFSEEEIRALDTSTDPADTETRALLREVAEEIGIPPEEVFGPPPPVPTSPGRIKEAQEMAATTPPKPTVGKATLTNLLSRDIRQDPLPPPPISPTASQEAIDFVAKLDEVLGQYPSWGPSNLLVELEHTRDRFRAHFVSHVPPVLELAARGQPVPKNILAQYAHIYSEPDASGEAPSADAQEVPA